MSPLDTLLETPSVNTFALLHGRLELMRRNLYPFLNAYPSLQAFVARIAIVGHDLDDRYSVLILTGLHKEDILPFFESEVVDILELENQVYSMLKPLQG